MDKMEDFYYRLSSTIHEIKQQIDKADKKLDVVEIDEPDDFNKILGHIRQIQLISNEILYEFDKEF